MARIALDENVRAVATQLGVPMRVDMMVAIANEVELDSPPFRPLSGKELAARGFKRQNRYLMDAVKLYADCERCNDTGRAPAIRGDRVVPGETMPCPACDAREAMRLREVACTGPERRT